MLWILFSFILLSAKFKGAEVYIYRGDSLRIKGAEVKKERKGDTLYISAELIIHNALNIFGIALERVEIELPGDILYLEITGERTWIYIKGEGLHIENAEISVKNGKIVFQGGRGRLRNSLIELVVSSFEAKKMGREEIKRMRINSSFSKMSLDLKGVWNRGTRFDLYSLFSFIDIILPDKAGFVSSSLRLYKKGTPIIRFELKGGMNRVRR